MSNKNDRQQRLDFAITDIKTRFGPKGVQQGVSASASVPHIPTGFTDLDTALGIGGIPKGKLTVLHGAITSGKHTLAALVLANAQKTAHRSCAYINLGGTCDAEYLDRCGVDLRRLFVLEPSDGREALDMAVTVAARQELGVIVFDAWGKVEADRATRRLAATALDQIVPTLARSDSTLIVLADLFGGWQGVVSSWTDPARSALAHHAAVRLALRQHRRLMLGPDIRGHEIGVTIERNKLGRAGQTVTITIRLNGTVRGDGL